MSRPRLTVLVGALALLGAVVMSYIPALQAGFIWDDDSNITTNFNLHDLDGLRRIWANTGWNQQQYYPLTHTTFWIEYHLWGLDPIGYHLVNVSLHAIGAILLWRILWQLGVPGAWIAASIFALHPLQVESVAWVTERKNTLSAVFFFAAGLAGIRFADPTAGERPGPGVEQTSRAWGWYALCVALFLCAVLAKSATSPLPVAIAIILWWKCGRISLRDLVLLVPLVILGATAGMRTAWMEQYHVGATGMAFDRALLEKVLIAGRAAWFYLGKLILPTDLCFIYPKWRIDTADPAAYLYPIAAVAALAGLWAARSKVGRGPLAAALYYGVMIFPALGFFNLYFMKYSYVQDHFQYLAGIGPIVLAAAGISRAQAAIEVRSGRVGVWARISSLSHLPVTVAFILLLLLGFLTWQRSGAYKDAETLWRDTIAANPQAWMAHTNLGSILFAQGRHAEAADSYRESLKLQPSIAESEVNLGNVLLYGGNVMEAIGHFQRAVKLAPGLFEARLGLGVALDRADRRSEAEPQFIDAIRLNPHGAEAPYYLARIRFNSGDTPAAASLLEELLRRKPHISVVHGLYGDVLAAQGMHREAEQHHREAERLAAQGL